MWETKYYNKKEKHETIVTWKRQLEIGKNKKQQSGKSIKRENKS